jgi:hypothetical protein
MYADAPCIAIIAGPVGAATLVPSDATIAASVFIRHKRAEHAKDSTPVTTGSPSVALPAAP